MADTVEIIVGPDPAELADLVADVGGTIGEGEFQLDNISGSAPTVWIIERSSRLGMADRLALRTMRGGPPLYKLSDGLGLKRKADSFFYLWTTSGSSVVVLTPAS
ncbi:MAG: hypothetical protein OXC09_03970 [Truepera sp.]|nr:hypothetical protein [Truepera sp.]